MQTTWWLCSLCQAKTGARKWRLIKECYTIEIHKRAGYIYMCTCDCKVLSGVSFWLCVQNSPGVCPSLDRASSSSLSWCCDGGDGTLTDVCSPLCPSLELSAWRRKKIEMPSQTWIFFTSWLHTASLMQFTWNLLKKKHCWSLNYLLFITCGVTWFVYVLHCVVVQLRSSLITIAGITPAWWFYLYKPHLSDLSLSFF